MNRKVCETLAKALFISLIGTANVYAKRAITVADSIETTRALSDQSQSVYVSPDGSRYLVLLLRGDLAMNGNWLELLTGRLSSLDDAVNYAVAGRMFTRGKDAVYGDGPTSLTLPGYNPVLWLDAAERIAFRWEGSNGFVQVVEVNLRTHQTKYLTRHPSNVVQFFIHPTGLLLYSAKVGFLGRKFSARSRSGYAVTNPDALSIVLGDIDGHGFYDQRHNTERYLVRAGDYVPRKIHVAGGGNNRIATYVGEFSPSGQKVIVDGSPSGVPRAWDKYKHPRFQQLLKDFRVNRPNDTMGRQLLQLFVIDVHSAVGRPLWNAPKAPGQITVAWAPDERSVMVGPTFLPISNDPNFNPYPTNIAEVDIESGHYWGVPLHDLPRNLDATELRWMASDLIRVGKDELSICFRKSDGKWKRLLNCADSQTQSRNSRIQVLLRQGLNDPPVLVAVDRTTGRERQILDLNPELTTDLTLGKVEQVYWKDYEGREWSGLLYYPVDYRPGRRFPLVLQSDGHAPVTEFSLYGKGPGLGPGHSVYVAQPLANRNIAVLQMDNKSLLSSGVITTPQEAEMYMKAYEAAADYLVTRGLVARNKIGILGFSRAGWYVEYALTHSEYPFAAALVADNMDASYIQAGLMGWPEELSLDNGASPFGDGLSAWLAHSPGFNAHRIRAPLRLQAQRGVSGILMQWEMFGRLRKLKRPVELYVIPDSEHSGHGLQNPEHCLVAQQGAVDWFDFWFNDYEDEDPGKADQYKRWRHLRNLQRNSDQNIGEVPGYGHATQ